ncbi:hypothetical protein DSLASN_49040 [Desulfoluna limicola]|uniref:Flagellar hook-length control protein-like C-terminal domain-containing protein n=1 Tax=Desulfoluna limicola TaxID=2810562 RepID=A0ABN6FBV5_9BACT|nr:flagellar hook-length control protein FliK [Desulfoluna limicola]BCS99272.1 hypothetical protein DSLASN_49040 [Desulfoluna limicola]
MQTAVQTTTETASGPQASGGRTGAKAKQAGGFAALLSAFFGKGGQPQAMATALAPAVEGAGSETPQKKGGAPAKKGQGLADLNAMQKNPTTLKKEDGEQEVTETGLPSFMAEVPLVSLAPESMKGDPALGAVLAQGMAGAGAEKSAGPTKGNGANMSPLKGGMDRMPFQAGGMTAGGNQPQAAGEMGVDQFAAMMRGAGPGKKVSRTAHGPSAAAGPSVPPLSEALSASPEHKVAQALAGAASGLGAKKGALGPGVKAEGAKGASLVETPLAGLTAGQAAKKAQPFVGGKEGGGKAPQVEGPSAATLRAVNPISMDRSGIPVQPMTAEAMATLNELEPSAAVDTPKRGLTHQLALQVGRQIATSLRKNDNEVTFQVRPPSLGRIQMRIEKEGEHISVRIVSEKEKAGEILAAGKQELRVLLADHGIKVDRIEIDAGGTMNLMAQDGGTEGRDGRGRSSPRHGDTGQQGEADREAAPPEKKRHDGVISVMV